MRDIYLVLERWGIWARYKPEMSYSTVAAGFRGLLPQNSTRLPSCCDEDGLIVDRVVGQLKLVRKPEEVTLRFCRKKSTLTELNLAKLLVKKELLGYSISDDMTCTFKAGKIFQKNFIEIMRTFDTIDSQNKNICYPCPYPSYGSYKYKITDNENKIIDGHLKLSEDMNTVSYFGSDRNLFSICENYGTNDLKLFIQPYLSFYHGYFKGNDASSIIMDLMEKTGDVSKDRYLIYQINDNKIDDKNLKMTLVVCLSQYKIGIHNPYQSPNGKKIQLHFKGNTHFLFEPVIIVKGTNIFSLYDFKYKSAEAIGPQSKDDDINKFNQCKTLRIKEEDAGDDEFFETNNIIVCKTIEPMMKDLFISFGKNRKINISNASKELAKDRMIIQFDQISYIIPNATFSDDIFTSTIDIEFNQGDRVKIHPVTIKINRTHNRLKIIHRAGIQCFTSEDAYYNVPLNTSFAKKLTARMNRGIDVVLSLSTPEAYRTRNGQQGTGRFLWRQCALFLGTVLLLADDGNAAFIAAKSVQASQ